MHDRYEIMITIKGGREVSQILRHMASGLVIVYQTEEDARQAFKKWTYLANRVIDWHGQAKCEMRGVYGHAVLVDCLKCETLDSQLLHISIDLTPPTTAA